jgi:hypothetical protein
LLLAFRHTGSGFAHGLLGGRVLSHESLSLGFPGGHILFELLELPLDNGSLALEGGCALHALGKLLRERFLLRKQRGQLAALGAEALVEDRAFLHRAGEALLQLAKALGIPLELLDGALVALLGLFQRRQQLAAFLFGLR